MGGESFTERTYKQGSFLFPQPRLDHFPACRELLELLDTRAVVDKGGVGVDELVPGQLIGGPGAVQDGQDPTALEGDEGADLTTIGMDFFKLLIELKICIVQTIAFWAPQCTKGDAQWVWNHI